MLAGGGEGEAKQPAQYFVILELSFDFNRQELIVQFIVIFNKYLMVIIKETPLHQNRNV